jgi:hypothetical protein
LSLESQPTQHNQRLEPANTVSLVNEDDNDATDSVMTEDFIPSTQTVAVPKSIVQSHQRQPAENVAVPSCSPAQPGLDLH